MLSRLREHLGSAGLVVAIVALVAALAGGAIAANGGSDGEATASATKGKQGPRGKTGKTGPQGPAGPAGPAGPQGPAGAKGDTGAPGSAGTNGTNGTSVTSEEFGVAGKDGKCVGKGGTKFVSASGPAYACNGKEGVEGSPWTAGGTLPSEATETGVWRFVSHSTSQLKKTGEDYELVTTPEPFQYVPISFPIPLSAVDAASITVETLLKEAPPTANCPGSATEPKAEPGFLCVYASPFETNFLGAPSGVYKLVSAGEEAGVNTSGALLYFESVSSTAHSSGSFAITAP